MIALMNDFQTAHRKSSVPFRSTRTISEGVLFIIHDSANIVGNLI